MRPSFVFRRTQAFALKIFIEERLVIIGADDVRAVAVELDPDSVMDNADSDIGEIIIRDASQQMELGQDIVMSPAGSRFHLS